MAGCLAVGGKHIEEIADEIGMSRSYVYEQKAKIKKYAEELKEAPPEAPILVLDKQTIAKIILTLTMECQSPNAGIRSFFEIICGINMSAGYISGVINDASKRAQEFDNTIDLSQINQMAVDEIFQCGTPILTGVDPISTYTFLLEEAPDRTAETWAVYLDDRKDKGLNPEVSINDGGMGIMAGVPQVFPEVEIQADTFHALYDMGKEVSKLERKALKLINSEYELEQKLAGKKPRAKHKESLEELQPKVKEAIFQYDLIAILYGWLKMLLNFSGYSLIDTHILSEWVLQELEVAAIGNPGLIKEVIKVRKLLPSLLSFIGRLERGMEVVARDASVPPEALQLMYRQMSYSPESIQGIEIHCDLVCLLGNQYMEVYDKFQALLNTTKKASSLVENLNGRIRVFIEVKRIIPTQFFVLMKVFYNTRRYKRSRCKERIGKSPLELLTGAPQPDFLAALGF
jgi:hypothetical protein